MLRPVCRFCGSPLSHDLVDLGATPLANSYLTADEIAQGIEKTYPLRVRVCSACFLVQADAPVSPEAIFSEYAYFSSYADSWVEHARKYAAMMTTRLGLGHDSFVVEVASNDGYLLQHFVAAGIPVLGIEPAKNVAEAARARKIPTMNAFFGCETATKLVESHGHADLVAANNVLAHVPDIADFVGGIASLLKSGGAATFEFPHLLNLVRELQFDTIYHEHFYYLSLVALERVLAATALRAFDVDELPSHGGSLRLYVCRADASHAESDRLAPVRVKERELHLDSIEGYAGFANKIEAVKRNFIEFLARASTEGKTVAAYGAAAKGNTFLNVCGVKAHDIVCVFDRNPVKQGRFLPGSHIPVRSPDLIGDVKPDYLVILPWNLRDEIASQMSYIREWRGTLVTAIPAIRLFEP
jgi:SAM-dependent methyltransferase